MLIQNKNDDFFKKEAPQELKQNETGENFSLHNLEEWHFGDNEQIANELFYLVKQGVKTATSYLFDGDNNETPYSILTNWDNSEKILLKTISLQVVEFQNVSAGHAFKEGENDRTLASWKTIHKQFFANILKKQGREFSPNIKVVCEEFQVIKIL